MLEFRLAVGHHFAPRPCRFCVGIDRFQAFIKNRLRFLIDRIIGADWDAAHISMLAHSSAWLNLLPATRFPISIRAIVNPQLECPMSDHKPPVYRLLSKNEGDDKLTEIGQVWATTKENVFSVVLDLEDTGEKLKFIMMPNTPKPKAARTADLKPAA
jgi:hypothetical protein